MNTCAFCSPFPFPFCPITRATKRTRRRQYGGIQASISPLPRTTTPIIPDLVGNDLDSWYIRRCVELAKRAAGETRPNPIVGCVLVSSDGRRILGEGYHKKAGTAHAEVNALADAASRQEKLKGCTAYVSVEPCSHYGRTPPCADTLVKAQVGRVVIGMKDPFEKVAGRGIRKLEDAGIAVQVPVENELCLDANEGFTRRVLNKTAFGTLKYAMTLDGKIATDCGSSQWITGADARRYVHLLRAESDAIIVGGETLRKDNPSLSVRLKGAHNRLIAPLRVVMTKSLDVGDDWDTKKFWNLETTQDELVGEPIILVDKKHGKPHTRSELISRGVHVEEITGIQPKDAAEYLAQQRDCMNVLWESGGSLAREAIADGSIQKVKAFIAPKIVGGRYAPSPVDGNTSLCEDMNDAIELERRSTETFPNGDILITGYISDTQK